MDIFETVAAISTPAGTGGIGVVRISGEDSIAIADKVFRSISGEKLSDIKGYTARLGAVYDGETRIDEVVALVFHGPRSYTGEDVVELMCHGGEIACHSVLRLVLDSGAVMAGRGEFTRRALLNGRITLTEAEAVADVINAASVRGELAAASLATGTLGVKAGEIGDRIMNVQANLSASIDFPEEDVDEIDPDELLGILGGVKDELAQLVKSYDTGKAVLRGVTAAIAGSPNVGKSTILNLMSGEERAIVTSIPGTTRDIVEQRIMIGGTTLIIADTAGIREGGDLVEQIGIGLARQKVSSTDIIIAVFDGSRPLSEDDRGIIELTRDKKCVAVINKNDLPQLIERGEIEKEYNNVVEICANERDSFETLNDALEKLIGINSFDVNEPVLANERQRRCAAEALDAVSEAVTALRGSALDACYALLAEALSAIYRLDGRDVTESVLDEVFANFCVGK